MEEMCQHPDRTQMEISYAALETKTIVLMIIKDVIAFFQNIQIQDKS